jgi:ornithine carbamoyltransferase
VVLSNSPQSAVTGADLVTTDVFASMGQEDQQQHRLTAFADYQVNHELMKNAAAGAVFMHCLPAHRGEEVSAELLEDESISVVWDEAENRLHAQKALMMFLLSASNLI